MSRRKNCCRLGRVGRNDASVHDRIDAKTAADWVGLDGSFDGEGRILVDDVWNINIMWCWGLGGWDNSKKKNSKNRADNVIWADSGKHIACPSLNFQIEMTLMRVQNTMARMSQQLQVNQKALNIDMEYVEKVS